MAQKSQKSSTQLKVLISQGFDPTTPEGYALVMADPRLQLAYQDRLDSFFQQRIVDVRNALRDLGWENGEPDGILGKNTAITYASACIERSWVGSGKNVVAIELKVYSLKTGKVEVFTDDLTKTPAELAAQVDARVPQSKDEIVQIQELDPISPEGYAKVLADPALWGQHAEAINKHFHERIDAVQKSLRSMGWSQSSDCIGKGDSFVVIPSFQQCGLSRHEIKLSFSFVDVKTNSVENGFDIDDDLTKNSSELAAQIDTELVRVSDNSNQKIGLLESKYIDAANDLHSAQAGLVDYAEELNVFVDALRSLQAHPDFSGFLPKTYYSGGELDPVGVDPSLTSHPDLEHLATLFP